ncbi:peptide chain release factor 1 [Phormidium tenue FACHB-886]|nr:peptide chain release factor 1 [Phormidium tenue FACHB-886]
MANPLQRLARLPWIPLLITAVLTNIWVFVLEFFLWFGAMRSPLINSSLSLLLSPPLGLITILAIAVCVGALAVYLLEIVYPNVIINAGVLWALVPCLLLGIVIKNLLPLPASLVSLDEGQLISMILGIFIKGKPYWRR